MSGSESTILHVFILAIVGLLGALSKHYGMVTKIKIGGVHVSTFTLVKILSKMQEKSQPTPR